MITGYPICSPVVLDSVCISNANVNTCCRVEYHEDIPATRLTVFQSDQSLRCVQLEWLHNLFIIVDATCMLRCILNVTLFLLKTVYVLFAELCRRSWINQYRLHRHLRRDRGRCILETPVLTLLAVWRRTFRR